jgi:methionyl-tRNA formyltransferase
VPALEALIDLRQAGAIAIAAVVTQPDRVGHRGRMQVPPVKEVAAAAGVEILQPERLRGDELDRVLVLRPDALVWAAYGNKVPAALIDAVGGRAVNVHPSLLPRWRGAAPIAHAILAGDAETGVTLMEATAELDAGPILAQERVPVGRETRGELETHLAGVGAQLLERELPRYLAGDLTGRPQDPALVTWAPKLDPADGELDLALPADALARIVRAFTPDPGAFTFFRGVRIGVLRASAANGPPADHGTFAIRDGVPHVAAGAGWLRLDEVHPAGKRAMSGADWARGLRAVGAADRVPS